MRSAVKEMGLTGVDPVNERFGQAGEHIHGQVAVGFVITGVAAYLSVRFLVRYFETHTLKPFAIYCVAFGTLSLVRFAAF